MLDDVAPPESMGPRNPPEYNPRQLVRLVQCTQCSRPFTQPVTLLCGHSVCQQCVPSPQVRENISYPNTLAHRMAIACPCCGQVQSAAGCRLDVTLSKLMDVVRNRIGIHIAQHPDTPTTLTLEEVVKVENESMQGEGLSLAPQSARYHGGLVASIFQMAEEGLLPFSADVAYQCPSPGSRLKRLDVELLFRLRDAFREELDCPLCYNTLLDPTTTPCGHTLCWHCLIRTLDHDDICIVCRQDTQMHRCLVGHSSNRTLVALLRNFCPDIIATRQCTVKEDESSAIGTLDTPLFICMVSIPTMPTWLHIFEPRYRLMIRRCIEGNRQFGMLSYNRAQEPQGNLGVSKFRQYGTLLQITQFNFIPDGRIYIECRGIARFRVLEHGTRDGYDVGRIERIDDVPLHREMALEERDRLQAPHLAAQYALTHPQEPPLTPATFPALISTDELFQFCRDYVLALHENGDPDYTQKHINLYGPCPTDPAVFAWWFMCVIPGRTEQECYEVLRMVTVRERLKTVYTWTRQLQARLYAPRSHSRSIPAPYVPSLGPSVGVLAVSGLGR